MPDGFQRQPDSVEFPARSAFAVTPSDTTDFLTSGLVPKFLIIGGAGALVVQMVGDAGATTLPAVAAGQRLDIRPRKVLLTGTTATGIVAFT